MTQWKEIITILENDYSQTKSLKCLFSLAFAQYGYTAYLIGNDKKEDAANYIKKTEKSIHFLLEWKAYPSRVEALKAAIIAYKIALNPGKAIYLGPLSLNHINNSLEIDSTCPYGWVEKANSEYFMPRVFGGSYLNAVKYYKKAIYYFELDPVLTKCNWYYMNTLLWLAKSYEKLGQADKAKATYKKMLGLDSKFILIKKMAN